MVAALAAALLSVPGVAGAQPPTLGDTGELEVTPETAAPGEQVAIAGDGCEVGASVELDLYNPQPIARGRLAAAGAAGEFRASVEIPDHARAGRAWLRATCEGSEGEAVVSDATILITRPPLTITWVNVIFGVGTALVVTGLGLEARRTTRRRRGRRSRHRRRRD